MARKRMIDPSFWVDEKLGTVSPLVRLLFMGLISQADDEGRLNGHPALIRSLIFAYDVSITVADVEEWLGLLAAPERKLIIRYEVDHQKYILIPNFKKHQTINKPQPSKLPEPLPDNYGNDTVTVDDDYRLKEEKLKEEKGIGSEEKGNAHPPESHSYFNDPIKDKLYNFALECKLKGLNIVVMERDIFFFLDKMDIEVIEEAIKKSFEKSTGFALKILHDWLNEGKTKKEQVLVQYSKVKSFGQNKPQKPNMPVYQAPSGKLEGEEKEELARVLKYLEEGA